MKEQNQLLNSLLGEIMSSPASLNEDQARHLLSQAGFTPTVVEIQAIKNQSAQSVVAQMISQANGARTTVALPAFLSASTTPSFRGVNDPKERQNMRLEQIRQGQEHQVWWMREMLVTKNPLHERMTLFWHNHFATSIIKVARSRMMWQQQQLIRQHGLGSFRALLSAIIKDPAMLIYLDNTNNQKGAPNENLARELFELFTLGEASTGGGYTERDIKESARALTGWSVDQDTGGFRFRAGIHDADSKTVLGRTGNWTGDDVLQIILERPQVATYIVGKLWREFVSDQPNPAEIERIANQFRRSDYDIAAVMRQLLLCDTFWAPQNRGSLIKSPVELLVGTMRLFQFNVPDASALVIKAAQLGQHILYPPNVKGWPGGAQWINATTLLERKKTCEQFLRANHDAGVADTGNMMAQPAADKPNLNEIKGIKAQVARRMIAGLASIDWQAQNWLQAQGAHMDREPDGAAKAKLDGLILALPPTQSIPQGTVGFAYVRALTLDPAYQLK